MNFLRVALSGKDNKSWDVARIMGLAGVLFLFGMDIYAVAKGQTFSATDFATAFASVMMTMGATLRLKQSTEPEC